MFWITPTAPGRSRITLKLDTDTPPKLPLRLLFQLPAWVDHVRTRSKVFDGDNVFLAAQDRILEEHTTADGPAAWRKCVPSAACCVLLQPPTNMLGPQPLVLGLHALLRPPPSGSTFWPRRPTRSSRACATGWTRKAAAAPLARPRTPAAPRRRRPPLQPPPSWLRPSSRERPAGVRCWIGTISTRCTAPRACE